MHLSTAQLRQHPRVFRHMTGLPVAEFELLVSELLPTFTAQHHQRLSRPNRQRAIGGGTPFALPPRDQFLLTVIWLRLYPMHEVLGFLFGVTHATVGRVIARVLPILEAAGRDTMRLPDPGKKHRRTLDALLAETPELAVVIDSFEQPVQRPKDRAEADTSYSGKKKQHTYKTQVAVDETDGRIVDVSATVRGPTADLTLLQESGLLDRLPPGVGGLGDLAYLGIAALHPQGLGATPRRKPRGKPRPAEDVAYNRAFARRRIVVEHTIGRMRCYQAVTQRDRHHRQHTGRVCAVAGLVNRCLGWKRR
jgi:hypothetical protein